MDQWKMELEIENWKKRMRIWNGMGVGVISILSVSNQHGSVCLSI